MPRILLVKTSSMGDVIHNLPVIADIRQHFPDMAFDWVVEQSFADIPHLHPAVNRVIPVAIRRWRRQLLQPGTWQQMAAFHHELRHLAYDWVLDTQGLLKSAVITGLARGPSYGQDRASAREPLAASFYQHKLASARGQHAVARNRELAALALGYPIPQNGPDYGLESAHVQGLSNDEHLPTLPADYVVGLHATSRDSKLWPQAHWIALGGQLAQQGLALVLPWAAQSEQQRALAIASAVPGAIVLPRLGLRSLATILAGAKAAIGVDTGLVHLAVALRRPTIALYTDTDPSLTGIYPAAGATAINLGGKANSPGVAEVVQALQRLAT